VSGTTLFVARETVAIAAVEQARIGGYRLLAETRQQMHQPNALIIRAGYRLLAGTRQQMHQPNAPHTGLVCIDAVDGSHSVAHFRAKKLARQSKFNNFVNALI
jgi:hypothetical protein